MQVEQRERIRAGRLADYKASPDYLRSEDLDARADEETIAEQAKICIEKVKAHVGAFGRKVNGPETVQFLRGTLNGIAARYGARGVAQGVGLEGCIGRMTDPAWWRRNLRRELLRKNENQEHAGGAIRKRGQCYVSDFAVRRKMARSKINRATLESLEVVNEQGVALNLQEVADKSISNPKLRRAELMTRCRGFEETAKYSGHVGLFITLTCPSRFHKYSNGKINKKWTDETIKEGQQYLCGVWQKIRAAWNRAGFLPYGFRVAEPHHDGCPHWHILLFVDPGQAGWFEPGRLLAGRSDHGAGVVGIAGKYALKDTPGEKGAAEHRFTCKKIDPEKGSATGYIAKYIAKNIDGIGQDGESVGLDFASGTTAETGAARVRVWAQTHNIRQFQQIGGPSVTVWRELRKVKTEQVNDLFELPRSAADRGLWSLFWVLQGGPDVARKDLTLKPAYVSDSLGKYGDEVKRVWGVSGKDDRGDFGLQTKLHTWTIQRAGMALVNASEALRLDERALIAGAEAWAVAHGFDSVSAFQAQGEAFSPWTRVNNCTDGGDLDQIEAEKLDALRGPGINFQGGEGKPTFESMKYANLAKRESHQRAPAGRH